MSTSSAVTYDRFRNQRYPWVVYETDKVYFLCEKCKQRHTPITTESLTIIGDRFAEQHKDCK